MISLKSIFLYTGLLLSFLLVLSCVQLYSNAQYLFGNKKTDAYWVTLSKSITPENIGRKELIGFSNTDIENLKKWKEVKSVYPIVSNDFKVSADGGDFIPFYTDMYLEAVDEKAIDIKNLDAFEVKNNTIPIIISREYLNLYNYGFALNQGLPQITEEFAKKIEVNINLTLKEKNSTYTGKLIGLSDRIHSVLVPKKFLDSINATQPKNALHRNFFTRLLVQVNDAHDENLISKLNKNGYETNQESLRSSKIKGKLYLVLRIIALLGFFIFILCFFMIINVIKMQFLEQKDALTIKYILGYSPKKMVQKESRIFALTTFFILFICLLLISIGQYILSETSLANGQLSAYLHPMLFSTLLLIPIGLYFLVNKIVYQWLLYSWKL